MSRDGRSWGHAVWPMGEQDQRFYASQGWGACSTRGCDRPPTHWTNYSYVTGRAGRVSNATRRACGEHAERFAKKHGAAVLDSTPGTQREYMDRAFAMVHPAAPASSPQEKP